MNVLFFDLSDSISSLAYSFIFGVWFGFFMGLIRYMMIHSFTKKS